MDTDLQSACEGFVRQRLERLAGRFLPAWRVPPVFNGYRIGPAEHAQLLSVLKGLQQLGVKEIGRTSLTEAMRRVLPQVDGRQAINFASYEIAEILLAQGPFAGNPLLAGLDEAGLANLAEACDSTATYQTLTEGRTARNYWAVMARCERARRLLGLPYEEAIYARSLEETLRLYGRNPLGFYDDSVEGRGQYDMYSFDVLLFLEPFWEQMDSALLEKLLRAHVRAAETLALENGATVGWGRSGGVLSICMTLELAALALMKGMAVDPERTAGLLLHALERLEDWFEDDLIAAHRCRITDGYRGPQRLLELTLNVLNKVTKAAVWLAQAGSLPVAATARARLFPPVDRWVEFEPGRAGVWMFRNGHYAFQFPVVGGYVTADYAASPKSPGTWENPADSPRLVWTPGLSHGGVLWATTPGRAAAVAKAVGTLEVEWDVWQPMDTRGAAGGAAPAARRRLRLRAEEHGLAGEEELAGAPVTSVHFMIPESHGRPLAIRMAAGGGGSHHALAVSGMDGWRSTWGEFDRVQEWNFDGALPRRLQYEVRPVPKILVVPGDHDYTRALYAGTPPEQAVILPRQQGRPPDLMADVRAFCEGCDILHLGWPEHLFARGDLSEAEYRRRYLEFIAAVGRSPVRVMWTMHNRLPHFTAPDWGRELYRAWAGVVDAVFHHSAWGMRLMRAELPYQPAARHVEIRHGHYGGQMRLNCSRAELERELGLSPCAIRLGVLGRAQKEKQVARIMAGFQECARPDLQLLVTALETGAPVPADPRIQARPRRGWLDREEIAAQAHVCDALLCFHEGGSYLTSGAVADAVGVGIPMIVNDWPFFREVLGEAGLFFDGTDRGLRECLEQLSSARLAVGRLAAAALQDPQSWERQRAATLEVVGRLGCTVW